MEDESVDWNMVSADKLVEIIKHLDGFEETQEALLELKYRDSARAAMLARNIVENSLGDDHLQAFAFHILYSIYPEQALENFLQRREEPGKALFVEALESLAGDFYLEERPPFLTGTLLESLKVQYERLKPCEREMLQTAWIAFERDFRAVLYTG